MTRWIYTDSDGERFEIEVADILFLIQTGEFYHPLSGQRVYDYKTGLSLEQPPRNETLSQALKEANADLVNLRRLSFKD